MVHTLIGGGLEHEWNMTFHSVGNGKSSQLTNSLKIFFGGLKHVETTETTNQ